MSQKPATQLTNAQRFDWVFLPSDAEQPVGHLLHAEGGAVGAAEGAIQVQSELTIPSLPKCVWPVCELLEMYFQTPGSTFFLLLQN